jgi:hypothetical protein
LLVWAYRKLKHLFDSVLNGIRVDEIKLHEAALQVQIEQNKLAKLRRARSGRSG